MILLQFVSTRFPITLSTVSLLLPAIAVINFVVLMLPAFNNTSFNTATNPVQKDLTIARISIICLSTGLICMSVSPNFAALIASSALYAFGAGYVPASRSLVTSLVEKKETGRLYGVLGILNTIGAVVAGPTLSGLFTWGLGMGGN